MNNTTQIAKDAAAHIAKLINSMDVSNIIMNAKDDTYWNAAGHHNACTIILAVDYNIELPALGQAMKAATTAHNPACADTLCWLRIESDSLTEEMMEKYLKLDLVNDADLIAGLRAVRRAA